MNTFTITDACRVLNLGRTSFYKLINNGQIKAHKLGRKTIILEQDLIEFQKSLPVFGSEVQNG